ncbi:DUF1996 domain-containing protein [Aspergillus ruber CBS 135680]|uniref:DUF1996 domain-containing protein n=1 Tax=Aspergillus ruber (strain CBS 135680) TaxID=1388766 RepID=A0A017SP63_ASPRC|nr:uncharacterized protein EURHEDRAFT_216986 [Aspergillus ruber CBS 135680]EYE98561.1 hypothetical protein EURHEDRAFT_216986 [Aspergillus ruber CBS 135680]
MTRSGRLNVGFVSYLAAFAGMADAFWRMPCRGRSGLARMDPLMDPGETSYHVHTVHGSGAFSMDADSDTLKSSDCTSCAVTQDKSAYWTPALYFMHENGTSQIVEEVGGMLAYYLLYGDNVKAFPEGFRMLAGDPFQRNFTWPIPDPPKSEWTGDQASQAALKQKAIGFNCLNYNGAAEASLGRHFLPNKTYLDEHCTDGVRFEMMFPSCWNGKDVDSDDHTSHVAYPSLVMDGTCPEGFETRIVSLFFETIWNTYAFKDYEGYFVLAHGDPTGFGYHGDFIQGWDQDTLEAAVKQCTNPSGQIQDCPLFDIQSESDELQCKFEIPDELKDEEEEVETCTTGLVNGLAIEWGPQYAYPISYTTSTSASAPGVSVSASVGLDLNIGGLFGNLFAGSSSATPSAEPSSSSTPAADNSNAAANLIASAPQSTSTPSPTPTPTPTSTTPTWTPTPTSSFISGVVEEDTVIYAQEVKVLVDQDQKPFETETGSLETLSTSTTTSTGVISTAVSMVTEAPRKRHYHGRHHRRSNF